MDELKYPVGIPQGESYGELLERVANTMPHKRVTSIGWITAVKASTAEEYELARRMWIAGNSPCCCSSPPVTISGTFTGPDWYILEEERFDMGMGGRWTEYRIESLTEKKEKFPQYCAGFED